MNKIKRNVIFIGGIHGVGKGTICKLISEKMVIKHLSSSKILKWNEISSKENKLVDNFNKTQSRLINGLDFLIKDDDLYLLDGHFCLLNSNSLPEKVSENTFKLINPKKIIVVTENTEIVAERLNIRDGIKYDIPTLKKMQDMELEHAKYLSHILCIPFLKITNNEINKLFEFIKK